MYANEILVNAAPEMLNYRGLKNRDKANQLLKRPVDWKEYCAVSSSAVGAAEATASDPSMANARAVRATEERPGIA